MPQKKWPTKRERAATHMTETTDTWQGLPNVSQLEAIRRRPAACVYRKAL